MSTRKIVSHSGFLDWRNENPVPPIEQKRKGLIEERIASCRI